MYFLEHLCDLSAREEHPEFIRMMQRDILKIIDLVAPDDGSGAANVKVVRKVLSGLQAKSYLQPQTVAELEECIKDRDQIGGVAQGNSPMDVDNGGVTSAGYGQRQGSVKNGTPMGKGIAGARLDKRQIEQRIEEDRERHKRLRENIWAVGPGDDDEYQRMLEETSDLGDDDFLAAQEEAEERKKCAEFHRLEMEGP